MKGVVVTSGRRFSVLVRHELFDRICGGLPLRTAAQDLGVSKTIATSWWQQAGGMRLTWGSAAAGLKEPGDQERLGGTGHRLSWAERTEIMRGRDQGMSYAEIGRRIGRDKAVVWREVDRNQNPDGD